ncbi:hypothetical protein [Mesorhizobium sp. M4B.F.Ca.ET.058.02.1.1]|uniref:hypothetical protein n=1 Tax=Mesorhizobium sp. M4B.F.Ca.ET.058.02.1.1 TaxID=2493675 RepID=UPI000F74D6B6|nr:hypothetical protein [Mesorhizobium sp. M4B.F.Ca.ET.058.02.1.1]AZO48036.1 hypothetical protein EJ073_09550 [Mesorhizobium sp. M4B.F.Ca.ET.058.02.1.1]
MSNLFGGLTTDGLEETQDRLGGFRIHDSGPYTGTIKAAYAGAAASSKAQSITVILATDDAGEYRETFWITNKNGENFFTKDGKKQPLPGFTHVDDMCLVTTNKPLAAQATEEKVMNIYDPDQKKEVPKGVQMLVELLGKKVTFGILKELKNKQAKNSAGVYEDTADSREENVTDKIFHYPSNLTVVEARKQIQTPTFYGAWVEKNKGQTRDRRSIKDGVGGQAGRSGKPGMPPKANDSAAKTTSLFGA